MDDLSLRLQRRSYGEHDSQFVDIASPPCDPVGTIVSYHGGYWRAAYGLELHEAIVQHCVALGWTVVNAEYRRIKAGEPAVWKAMASDVQHAAMIARGVAGAAPLIALGHSAGGHLALWVTAQREVAIDAVVALAPLTDLVAADQQLLSNRATMELFGVGSEDDLTVFKEASPRHLLPLGVPQLIVHGPNDEQVPYDLTSNYVDAARSLGDEVTFVNPSDIDHFNVIDPDHDVWRSIDTFLDTQGESN